MCLYAIYCNILRTTRRDDEAFSLACLRVCYNPYEERGILSRCSRGAWARPSFARGDSDTMDDEKAWTILFTAACVVAQGSANLRRDGRSAGGLAGLRAAPAFRTLDQSDRVASRSEAMCLRRASVSAISSRRRGAAKGNNGLQVSSESTRHRSRCCFGKTLLLRSTVHLCTEATTLPHAAPAPCRELR